MRRRSAAPAPLALPGLATVAAGASGRPGRAVRRGIACLVALLLAGCPAQLRQVCPRCGEITPERPPALPADLERLYVLVPGILGYGWEWNGAQIALAQVPRAAVVVAGWDPWGSLERGGERVRAAVQRVLRRLPPRTKEVVLLGHSVGGLVVALAASRLQVPAGVQLRALTIGAPFAGTRLTLIEYEGSRRSPSPLAMGGMLRGWPRPAPGVTLEVYPTTWPNDPVMRPRMGYDPARRDALPPGARLRALPRGMDHNLAVGWVAEQLLAGAREELARGGGACVSPKTPR